MIASLISFGAWLLTGATPRWHGCAPEPKRRLYFANHTSNLDFVLLWAALPSAIRRHVRPVAAHDYWTANRLRQWLAGKVFRAVLIERKNVTRENNPLGAMIDALGAGDSLIIFPEGGRTASGEVGAFKAGIFHLARQVGNLELVPVYIDNLSRVLPKGEILPVPILCSVHFGCPMQLAPGETKAAFLDRAHNAVLALKGT